MHGSVFVQLEKFLSDEFGRSAWRTFKDEAGAAGTVFVPMQQYDDDIFRGLLSQAANVGPRDMNALQVDLGRYLVPGFAREYGALIKNEWRALDLIEHAETSIHTAVRLRDAAAQPPKIECTRKSPTEVVIIYNSERKFCGIAKGIAAGVGEFYGEKLEVKESTCQHKGASQCKISVRLKS